MATYFWVGGSGTWNNSLTTNWSLSSGGSGGAGVPTSTDNVVFDTSSNVAGSGASYTVTVSSGTGVCADITATGPGGANTVSFSGNNKFTTYGNLQFSPTVIMAGATTITFAATTSVNVNFNGATGASSGALTFSGTGTWTLLSAIIGAVAHTSGTIVTNNYNISGTTFASTGTNTRALTLGTSTITTTSSAFTISGSNITASTSSCTVVSQVGFAGNGLTYNSVTVNLTSAVGSLSGSNTYTNLTLQNTGAIGTAIITASATQTITGTFTTTTTAGNYRIWVQSATPGTQVSINVSTSTGAISLSDILFTDINASGLTFSGTRIGNGGNNTNITPTTARTIYWSTLSGTQNWTANGWSDSDTNTPSVTFYPLPQDTVKITNTSAITTLTITNSNCIAGVFDMSLRTSALTVSYALSAQLYIFSSYTNGSGLTISVGNTSSTLNIVGRGSTSITSAGVSYAVAIKIDNVNGTTTLNDALTTTSTATSSILLNSGGFNTSGYSVTCPTFSISGGTTRSLTLGTSTVTCSSPTSPWSAATTTNLTFSGSSSTIVLSDATASSSRTFAGGGLMYGTLTIGGGSAATQTVTLSGANSFATLSIIHATTLSLP